MFSLTEIGYIITIGKNKAWSVIGYENYKSRAYNKID
jgi:hypothetical protein